MASRSNKSFLLAGGVLLLFARLATAAADNFITLRGNTMGTTYAVKFHAAKELETQQVQAAIDARLDEINQRMSTYLVDSEVSRFNRAAANEWFHVSAETADLVALALEISQQTDSAFDVTVGPVVRLWNFGPNPDARFSPPEQQRILAALEVVGNKKLEVRARPPAIRKSVDGLEIDLSAIAKGYAVDEVARVLQQHAIRSSMIEIGGEMRVSGNRPDGSNWQIGIESPVKNKRSLHAVIAPETTAIASSGNYRNFYDLDGKTYSHTIDPRFGRPVEHRSAAVTVLASDCATADALATALMVMGRNRGLKWAEQNDVAAFFISHERDGSFSEARSSQFPVPFKTRNAKSQGVTFAVVFLPALAVFGIAIIGMSIGVIVSNRRLRGSCGGLAGMKDEHGNTLCEGCAIPSPSCRGEPLAPKKS